MVTFRSLVYLVYAALILVTFLGDKILQSKNRKTRLIGTIVCLIADFGILGFGIYLYLVHNLDQAGFILGSILFIVCILCLLGRRWQNKEADKRDMIDRQQDQSQ
ncbi:MAG: hypothetical protein ACTTKO_00975 [Candidatus Limimorpha sp.]